MEAHSSINSEQMPYRRTISNVISRMFARLLHTFTKIKLCIEISKYLNYYPAIKYFTYVEK